MPELIANLQSASEHALNDEQRNMLLNYITYFDTGSLMAHKEGSRHWIKDKGPAVETYVLPGFYEHL